MTAYDQWRLQSREDEEEELTDLEIQERVRQEQLIDAAESGYDYVDVRNSSWGWR